MLVKTDYRYSIIITLALSLGVAAVPSEKETESEKPKQGSENASPTVTITSTPKVEGSNATKVKLTVDSEFDKNFTRHAVETHQAVTSVISKIDATPAATTKTLPFINMEKWQKYSTISCREFFKAKRNYDVAKYREYMEEIPELLGELHDDTLAQAVDAYDDNVLEARELKILRKVKKYFKQAAEGYLKVPLQIDRILHRIDQADQSDLENFGLSGDNFVIVYIVKENVPKGLIVNIECYLNENAIDLKYMLRPTKEIEQFIAAKKFNPATYTTKEEIKRWSCNSEEKDKIQNQFVLLEFNKIFTKPETPDEPIQFQWLQTYHLNKRIEITDAYRLRFKVYDRTEPSEEEKAKIKKEKEAKIAKEKRKEERRRRNRRRELKKRRRKQKKHDSDTESDYDG